MAPKYDRKSSPPAAKAKPTSVTVFHVGPRDHDLESLAGILESSEWKLCPGTKWTLAATDEFPADKSPVQSHGAPIVLCERESAFGNWKDVLQKVRTFAAPPLLIVSSRTADEYLWAEALNLGAYDVLSKPYRPAEVVRVLSMAWLHWMNRRLSTAALSQAS